MAEILNRYFYGCIDGVVGLFMEPIIEPLNFFVSSTKYVKDMKDAMAMLDIKKQGLQDKKEAAEANNLVVPNNVEPWLEDFARLSERANLIEIVGPFNAGKRHKAGKESFGILKEIKLLEERKSNIQFTNEKKPLPMFASTSEHGYNFESRVPIFNALLAALQSNSETQKMIALCGMGGLGKTTLMEQLHHKVQETNTFHKVVKVAIGQTSDPVALQQIFAECLTRKDLTEKNTSNRAEHLRQEFVNMSEDGKNKILVIMDDIWEKIVLKNVGLSPLPNGFKLLLVSRDESVCTRMLVQPESIFNIQFLNDEESETLFFTIARPSLSNDDHHALTEIGKRIVKKCSGLPIAITTIAENLSGSIKQKWEVALERLEKDDLKDLESITHVVFGMSYENLQEDDYKAVFLLCGLFPGGFNIPIEDLMVYGWGLELFTEAHTLRAARTNVHVCVDQIIHAKLLTKGDRRGCVKMHDLVRAFVLSNFSKFKQASIVNHNSVPSEHLTNDTCERILLKCTGMYGLPEDFNHPNLLFLRLMDGYEHFNFPEDMYKRMPNLEVVSYENMGSPLLPGTFEYSSKLRTLCLHSCSLTNDLSFLGRLSNLETLSLADCNIRRLPSTIGKLKKLKLLDLTGCVDLHIECGVFRELNTLEELYMRASKGRPVRFVQANCAELEKLSHHLFALELEFYDSILKPKNVSFENLIRFRISIGCELKNYEKYSFRNTLNLVAECTELNESKIGELFKITEELHLQVKHMIHLTDVSLHHTFSQLRFLHVSKCAEMKYLFTIDVANGLKQLEWLTISKCHLLETLIGESSEVRPVTLKKLNFMSLEDLPKMVSLCDNVVELPEMVELKLARLPNFMSIFPDDNCNTSEMQELLNKKVVIPRLEKLDVMKMENLKQIWPSQISASEKNDVSMLRRIIVGDCDSLLNLFPINPLPLLNNLEELIVESCNSIEVLFNIDFKIVSETGKHNSRLRRIEVYQLGKLKELWRMKRVNESYTLVDDFKDVQTIRIEECDNFTDIFTPSTTNFYLGALTTYVSIDSGRNLKEREGKNKMLESDEEIKATYPSYLLHTCHHLQRLELSFDRRVGEVVFDMDYSQLATIQRPLLLRDLQSIQLRGLWEMSHVWKCNFHQPLQSPFQSLTDIYLATCHKIKYLFSPLMAEYLSNLKSVRIDGCIGIEEISSNRYDEKTTSISFPHLDILHLFDLRNLKCINGEKTIWSRSDIISSMRDHLQSAKVIGAYWSLCQYPRKIYIGWCDTLASLIPWYAVGQMNKLQELEIVSCKGMRKVFENEMVNKNINNVDEQGGVGTSSASPKLKNMTTAVVPQLSNLKTVCIEQCDLLSHVFTISTLESLKQLKVLTVRRCKAIQVIVQEEENTGMSSEVVVFPCLERLELDDLPNLKGFFLGKNEFQCPSLVHVMINDCPQWEKFTSGELKTPKLKNVQTSLGIYSLECVFNFQTTFPTSSDPTISKGMPLSFHNLIEIDIKSSKVGKSIIPSNAMLQLEKLQQISIKRGYELQEVFEVIALEGTNESQTVIKIPNVTQVNIENADGLKYLWKSNPWMVLEFPNLTTVTIHRCPKLEHVFTCSMAGSLVQLQDLSISECRSIEVIVKEEEEGDAKVNEIMLPRLNSLKLDGLWDLKGFCLGKVAFSLPALDTLQIKNCLTITVFTKGHLSTPELKEIDTSFGMCDVRTDVNSFIETKKEEGHGF